MNTIITPIGSYELPFFSLSFRNMNKKGNQKKKLFIIKKIVSDNFWIANLINRLLKPNAIERNKICLLQKFSKLVKFII